MNAIAVQAKREFLYALFFLKCYKSDFNDYEINIYENVAFNTEILSIDSLLKREI